MRRGRYCIENIRLLVPRAPDCASFLAYLLTPALAGEQPSFPDKFFARKFNRHPETVARWRARWEDLGILKTKQLGTKTQYAIDFGVLDRVIEEAKVAKAKADAEACQRDLLRRAEKAEAIANELLSQCSQVLPTPGPDLEIDVSSGPNILRGQQITNLNNFFVLTDEEKVAKNLEGIPDFLDLEPDLNQDEQDQGQEQSRSQGFKQDLRDPSAFNSEQSEMSWFRAAAERLVQRAGQQWNPTLQAAIEGLPRVDLANTVAAFWQQSLRGKVVNGAAWLNAAINAVKRGKPFLPTERFRLPSRLPDLPEPSAPIEEPQPIGTLPDWVPVWAREWVLSCIEKFGPCDRLDEVDGGLQGQWGGHRAFLPRPGGLMAGV
jgi:hypothetical protein